MLAPRAAKAGVAASEASLEDLLREADLLARSTDGAAGQMILDLVERLRGPTVGSEARAWVLLPSGQRLDLLNPTPFDWTDEDMAIGLARCRRWGGHGMSVAQHALATRALRESWSKTGLSPAFALREQHHDDEEGLLGFDPILPLKRFLGSAFEALLARLSRVVWQRYRLPAWDEEQYRLHKKADRLMAASEAYYVVRWSPAEIKGSLKISLAPLERDPLALIYKEPPWSVWPEQVAAERFLAEHRRLMAARETA